MFVLLYIVYFNKYISLFEIFNIHILIYLKNREKIVVVAQLHFNLCLQYIVVLNTLQLLLVFYRN